MNTTKVFNLSLTLAHTMLKPILKWIPGFNLKVDYSNNEQNGEKITRKEFKMRTNLNTSNKGKNESMSMASILQHK